ncbi:maleylpyruvate isomerase N-terminal domain-containing protein [Streptomyces sp. NPDC001941]|uniref:maleylpyruvate isomerase N-terminal domain-containing protein n=1 Tax=Streptomyces sp. NPDC001941 TaxID=3154659 RepID=UPI003324847A
MDYVAHFRREVEDFGVAVRSASRRARGGGAVPVPSCPGWSLGDLVFHLGAQQRRVAHVVGHGLLEPPPDDVLLGIPESAAGLRPRRDGTGPWTGPVPEGLLDWFAQGAEELAALFASRDPAERVWTWSAERSVGFWARTQAIEAAVHRWDAQDALGAPGALDRELAVDAVGHTFEVMAPARRAARDAPPGGGERLRFRQSDGFHVWVVQLEDEVLLYRGSECCLVELTATASELALFLWHRIPKDGLEVRGDAALLDRWFKLVPPV